ncbi:MAG: DUF3494 domain-containing protein [Bacteroidetes bacterium]|nr:DUF3494 domain-containing protein [Bacteroidota bacterium]
MKRTLHLAIATVALFFNFSLVQAQVPNLGTAVTFGLFTSVGAIDNLANTVITGDVGTNVGAFNGFPPAIVIGQIHVADPVSAQVAVDVNLAYTELVANPCGTVLGTGLGGGQVLTPGVYCIGAAAILNGDLTFDAQGDPNAVFIVQIDGALSTGLGAQVLLLNSASSCNIYWQINGAVTFGDNSAFQGVVLANGQMTFLVGATLEGKALTVQGAIAMNENTINSCAPALLPVALVDFNAEKSDAGTVANLTWKTLTESNSDYFLMERSLDGIKFETIGKQLAAGYSDLMIAYTFMDETPASGNNYYRLQQVDQDGLATYSTVQALTFAQGVSVLSVYPNPFNSTLVLRLDQVEKDANFEWQLLDAMGKQVMHSTLKDQVTRVDMTTVSTGIYFYRLTRNGVVIQSGKMIAQN